MVHTFIVSCFVDITVSFSQLSYIVMEGDRSAQTMLILSDIMDCYYTISVWVDIIGINATGKYVGKLICAHDAN